MIDIIYDNFNVIAVSIIAIFIIHRLLFAKSAGTCPAGFTGKAPPLHDTKAKESAKQVEEVIEKSHFTLPELREFNGENNKPVYICLKNIVYDVSKKRDMYGPGAGYHLFAGRDASRALAKMSFEAEDLDNPDISNLNFMEKEILNDWVTKYEEYNSYPVVGRLVKQGDITAEELHKNNGLQGNPVYVALNGVVYDVTMNGYDHYGPNGSYNQFAGQDATKSLACMSFDAEHITNPSKEGLTDAQLETLRQWEVKFAKKYAVVGKLLQ